jgi:Avidin family
MTAMASIAPERDALSHSLQGIWYNQLGSELAIEVDGKGTMRGTYRPGAGAVAGNTYPVAGSYDPRPTGKATVLGFVVDWTEVHSVTVWSGQYHRDDGTIRATWLMAAETEVADEWKSTFIGHDVFHRDRITAAASEDPSSAR